jgi:ribonucleoside-diphosphate reductase alpha chain
MNPAVPRREQPILFDDPVPADLPPATLTENARIVLAKRYLKKDESGSPRSCPRRCSGGSRA